MQVEVEPFEPSAKSAHAIYPLVRRSSIALKRMLSTPSAGTRIDEPHSGREHL
jgi:hypothetical protein